MKSILTFLAGLTIGAGVSWVYHKNKYEQMVQDEVEALRDHAKEKEEVKKEPVIIPNESEIHEVGVYPTEEELEEANEIVTKQNYNTAFNKEENDMAQKYKTPFVVTPDDFASLPGFDTDTFYFHHDNIISNSNNEMVEEDEIERILGMSVEEIGAEFGRYEDDSVFIRNMRLKCDYEVLKEEENFEQRNGD